MPWDGLNEYALIISDPPQVYLMNNGSPGTGDELAAIDYELTVQVAVNATVTLASRGVDNVQLLYTASVLDTVPPLVLAQPYNGQWAQLDVLSIDQLLPVQVPLPLLPDPSLYVPDSSLSSYTPDFQVGKADREDFSTTNSSFAVDDVNVWDRALTLDELDFIYNKGVVNPYPFLTGPVNLIFQGQLIGPEEIPLVLGTGKLLWSASQLYDSDSGRFQTGLTQLHSGVSPTRGYAWTADNFYDKLLFAQHDNPALYWIPGTMAKASALPGLMVGDEDWNGVAVFSDHVLLWKEDRLKWSDKDDFSLYIPIATTAISAVYTLAEAFDQPPPGKNVNITITNILAQVLSLSLEGDLSFDDVNGGPTGVGKSSETTLNLVNTGTGPLKVTGISVSGIDPSVVTWDFKDSSGVPYSTSNPLTIPIGGSSPVTFMFTPADGISYAGTVSVAADNTQGTSQYPISGTGGGSTNSITILCGSGGTLTFGDCLSNQTAKEAFSITSGFAIRNDGTAAMPVSSIDVPGGFTVDWSSGSIAPGATQIVKVTFTPAKITTGATQDYSGTITVNVASTDNVTVSGATTLAVTGTGVKTFSTISVGGAVFVTDQGSLQFSNVPVGTPVNGEITVYNLTIAGPVKLSNLLLPAGFSGQLPSGSVPPRTTNALTSVSFPVSYTPSDSGLAGGPVSITTPAAVSGIKGFTAYASSEVSGMVATLSGNLAFGDVPVGGSAQALLVITNIGTDDVVVSGIELPSCFTGQYNGTLTAGQAAHVPITFSPTEAQDYSGINLTVNFAGMSSMSYSVSGTGFTLPTAATLVAGQIVSLEDTRGDTTYYNYYTVVSMTGTQLVLTRMDTTGSTLSGTLIPADGRQFFTLDANEAGETRVVGSLMNGPIYQVVPQGDYAYMFKERSIQSIQYTGLGAGTFFVHNEVHGEGLLARNALCDRLDGTLVFLGQKELYTYQGGPNPLPVCQQATRQLYAELDRSRLDSVALFHKTDRKEIWVKYPIIGGFRVLIWNYIEDSATLDDYDSSLEFTAMAIVTWSADQVWETMARGLAWADLSESLTWADLSQGDMGLVTLLGTMDGGLQAYGRVYSRDGQPYTSFSETMDFDFREPDIWKYVDVVVVGLEVKVPEAALRYLTVQVGTRAALGGYANSPGEAGSITWTPPKQILVNGQAPVPVKINPGAGAGKYMRVRFTSSDVDVKWRVSSFELHCRPGGLY
jgi:hypothetical protein